MTWFNACEIDGHDKKTSNMETCAGKYVYCPLCRERGQKAKLRLFQINAKESLMLCSTKTCTYPMGLKPSKNILVERCWSAAVMGQKRKLPASQQSRERQKSPRSMSSAYQSAKRPRMASNVETTDSLRPFTNNVHSGCPPKSQNTSMLAPPKLNAKIPVPVTSPIQINGDDGHSVSACRTVASVSETDANTIPCNPQSSIVPSRCQSQTIPSCVAQNPVVKRLPSADVHFLQWLNRDKLCWLDAVMCMIVHSRWIQEYCQQEKVLDTSLVRLVKCYREANDLLRVDPCSASSSQVLVNNCQNLQHDLNLESLVVNGDSNSNLSLGRNDRHLAQICLEKAETIMSRGQESMWRHLQPKLRCLQGEENSAACGLMAVLSTEPAEIQQLCSLKYHLQATCSLCGYIRKNLLEKRVVVFPTVPADFTMSRPQFHGTCDKCQAVRQTVVMDIQRYPQVLFSHFVEGVPSLTDLDFTAPSGSHYKVKAVVRYTKSPDHFVAWIRDTQSGRWMECDDLKKNQCAFGRQEPIPPREVHLVMWEKATEVTISDSSQMWGLHASSRVARAQQTGVVSATVSPHIERLSLVQPPKVCSPLITLDARFPMLQALPSAATKHGDPSTQKISNSGQLDGVVCAQKQLGITACQTKAAAVIEKPERKAKPPSREQERIDRMRQRFREKTGNGGLKQTNGVSMWNGNSGPKSVVVVQKRSSMQTTKSPEVSVRRTVKHAEPVKLLNSNRESNGLPVEKAEEMSPNSLKSAMAKSDDKNKLESALSHRVLKFLPEHLSLPFELSVLQDVKAPHGIKMSTKDGFTGYVSKGGLSNSEMQEKQQIRSPGKGSGGRKKNVQFVLDVDLNSETSTATAMFMGGAPPKKVQKKNPKGNVDLQATPANSPSQKIQSVVNPKVMASASPLHSNVATSVAIHVPGITRIEASNESGQCLPAEESASSNAIPQCRDFSHSLQQNSGHKSPHLPSNAASIPIPVPITHALSNTVPTRVSQCPPTRTSHHGVNGCLVTPPPHPQPADGLRLYDPGSECHMSLIPTPQRLITHDAMLNPASLGTNGLDLTFNSPGFSSPLVETPPVNGFHCSTSHPLVPGFRPGYMQQT